MIFSLSSFVYAFIGGSILSILFLFLLNIKTLYSVIYPSVLLFFSALIMTRFLMPGELFFAKTITTTFLVPDIYDFFRRELFLKYNLIDIFILLWIIGSIFCLFYTIYQYHEGDKQLKQIRESATLSVLSASDKSNMAKREIKIFQSKYISSPFSAGLKDSAIYLPYRNYTEENLQWIFLHESSHIKNKDLWKNIILKIITILFWWFIPLYFQRKVFILLYEIKVDQKVLEKKDEEESLKYAKFLIEEMEQQFESGYKKINATAFSTIEGWMMGKRLSYILEKKRKLYLNFIFSLLMGLFVISSFSFVIEPDYSNSEYTKEQFGGLYGQEDFKYGKIQEDGSVDCYLKNGEIINFPSRQLVGYIFPELKIVEKE